MSFVGIEVASALASVAGATIAAIASYYAGRNSRKNRRYIESIIRENRELRHYLDGMYLDDDEIDQEEIEFYVHEIKRTLNDSEKRKRFDTFIASFRNRKNLGRVFSEIARKMELEQHLSSK